MNTLNLTIPLTVPQLAGMLCTQFSLAERQQLIDLVKPTKRKTRKPKPPLPFVAEDLRETIMELNQYKRGEIQLHTPNEILDEL